MFIKTRKNYLRTILLEARSEFLVTRGIGEGS